MATIARLRAMGLPVTILDVAPALDASDPATFTQRLQAVAASRSWDDVDLFVGKRIDVLRREKGELKVLRRTIYLDQSVLLSRNLTTFF